MCHNFSITTNKWYTHKCINFIMLLGAQAFVHVKRLVLSHCALVWLTSGGLGFWWILRPCLPWFVRFSDLLLCCFFCFLFWFSIWVHGGLFGSLIWIVGCFIEWLVAIFWMVGGVLVAGFSSLHGVLGDGWWWFVQLCLHLAGWELCKIFPFTVKQTLKNDFNCIFKLATKHGIMKIFY